MIKQPKTRTVRVLSSFAHKDGPTKVGEVLTLDNGFAHEMRHAGRVEFLDSDPTPIDVPKPPPPNAIPESMPRDDSAKKGK